MHKCKDCGAELKLGKFAYKQETCWDCFKNQAFNIIYSYPVNSHEREMLFVMIAIVGEHFGENWHTND